MNRPVDKVEFWKERLGGLSQGDIHKSVYRCNHMLWEKIEERHVSILKGIVKPTDSVLDAACGYGRMSQYFSNYTGIDFSPDFINKANALHPEKRFIEGNLKKLPFDDEHFDCAFGVSIKEMIKRELGLDEWLVMEEELKRVAKKVIFLEYSDGNNNHLIESVEVIEQ